MIKPLTKHESTIPTLTCDGVFCSSDQDKALILNQSFYNNFSHSSRLITDAFPPCNIDSLTFPSDLLCTEDQVYQLVSTLDCSKASGNDNISAQLNAQSNCL